jgi:hypothetical protein
MRAREGAEGFSAWSQMLMLPPAMVEHLRTGLYRELQLTVTEIATISSKHGKRIAGPYRDPIYRMNVVKGLLDAVGWELDQSATGVRVDMSDYRVLVLTVLQRRLDTELDILNNTESAERLEVERRVGELREFIADLQSLPVYLRADERQ